MNESPSDSLWAEFNELKALAEYDSLFFKKDNESLTEQQFNQSYLLYYAWVKLKQSTSGVDFDNRQKIFKKIYTSCDDEVLQRFEIEKYLNLLSEVEKKLFFSQRQIRSLLVDIDPDSLQEFLEDKLIYDKVIADSLKKYQFGPLEELQVPKLEN